MLARLDGEIENTSISRPTLKWGVTIPWDPQHVTYVWIEALMNYYSATRIYGKEEFWPTDVNFVGKGINWFHSVIWPALLLALELPLQKEVFVHGYYNVEGKKMGKSLGNVISPQELLEKYGVDGTRYLLCASMPYENDSDVSFTWFDQKYNADLANSWGNLVSRVAKLAEGQKFNNEVAGLDPEKVFNDNADIAKAYETYRLHDVVSQISALVSEANEYLNQEEPWKKPEKEKREVLITVIKKIVVISRLLEPITPHTSTIVREAFIGDVAPLTPLFNRIA